MSPQEHYVAQIEAHASAWAARLAAMKTMLEDAELQGRVEFHLQLEATQRQHEAARRQLDELERVGELAMEELRAGVEAAFKELNTKATGPRKQGVKK